MRVLIFCLTVLVTAACHQNNKSGNTHLELNAEIAKWKKELLDNKQIGNPCDYKSLNDSSAQQWIAENPGQLDGLPDNESEIKSVTTDLNGDSKNDLLLYFQSKNCTGHNGGTKTYAKIIYSDGTSQSDIVSEIIRNIREEYNKRRSIDKNLKETMGDYLETTTTIDGYIDGISGVFRLYTSDDPHCCPSYNGKYIFNSHKKKIELQISENSR